MRNRTASVADHRLIVFSVGGATCSPLSRPHNLHYVEMPATQGMPLRACRCAGFLIVIVRRARRDQRGRVASHDRRRHAYPLRADLVNLAGRFAGLPLAACG